MREFLGIKGGMQQHFEQELPDQRIKETDRWRKGV
jgi:hypothetical protein